ncbi:hypothetical protein AMC90_PB00088 (plasmid) [Rhizobium phaseoli]|uniref:hypothetical protein n=1 Tax=Rhizobium phaseoli TaxID=396 RepID=UPI0007E9475E|nr:hypothetical protein [Rhizobium phaseoli]ANL30406.1 hypothetical protein AMC90_PB00088 [Rhizobium phaseoli]ANL67926.1 hypothetical protein AMC84_PA00095 [Rhizobium phaseoli]ANL80740.1 hypothetical protein AMC82_PA00095 [Rhizobium phaseoli]ANM06565.1 hypothetical protein AMC78_PA00098 [Rhizobium phaseoli]PCD66360.1 hypothetical protein CO648_19865 [Rhizobium phaseoli]
MLQNAKRVLFVLAAAGLVSGCADYMNNRDTITFGVGNAVEANKAIHIQDPFPPEAQRTQIASDGKVIRRVVTQYQNGGVGVVQPSPAMGANGASNGATVSQ